MCLENSGALDKLVRLNPPRVALNGRFSGTLEPTGTQTVAFYLFDAIVRAPRDFELFIFADPAFPGIEAWRDIPGTIVEITHFTRWTRIQSQLWEQFVLPAQLIAKKCVLVHHPMVTCPRWGSGVRSIVTLHDLNFYHHPEWVSAAFRRWMMATAIPGIRRASHVVSISDYVLEDVRRVLKLPAAKTSRIYNGVKQVASSSERSKPRQAFQILGVNLWQPHKNLLRLLDAIEILRVEYPKLELHLVGRPQDNFRKQPELAVRIRTVGVKILGYLSSSALEEAYRTATVFAYPSLEEGFGLPVLEAMSAGTPVVTSNVSCLPEIAGGAAILVDPFSAQDIARGLRAALMETPAQRQARIQRGKDVASRFTWESAADQYVLLYETFIR